MRISSWMKMSLVALAMSFPFIASSHAYAQTVTIELQADNAIAESSNDGVYPAHDVAEGTTLYWEDTPDSLPATVWYYGPNTTLNCEWHGGGDSWSVGNGSVINFSYEPGGVGTDDVECYVTGVSAEVQYKILPD